jgi:type IV pilus assembly protein PilM
VDVNSYALERAMQAMLPQEAKAQTIALLNVNLAQSSMIVMHKMQMIHAHDQTFDGLRLIKQVDDFIKTKRAQPGMENMPMVAADAAYHAILQENFLSHLRHTIHFFYSSRSNITIDKIMLAGDCTIIPDFAAFIENEIGIKTTLADPFANMKINSRLDAAEIMKIAPTMMLCSGLALSGAGVQHEPN